jgi:heme exporter protein D
MLNDFRSWYQEQYLVARVCVWIACGLTILAMILWVTRTPTLKHTHKHTESTARTR